MSLAQILLLAAMAAGAALAVIRRAHWLGATVVACAGLALVVTIVASSAGRRDRVRIHGETIELTRAEARGREQFVANCSNCHTLNAVHAVAQVGPDLDFVRPPAAIVRRRIHDGSEASWAVMPPNIVTGTDAADVAAFLARVAGR